MAEGSRDYFLKLSQRIVQIDTPHKISPHSKPRPKTKSPHQTSISSLNFDDDKSPITRPPTRTLRRNLVSPKPPEKENDTKIRPVEPEKPLPAWQATVMKSFKRLHRKSSSITIKDATTEKNSSQYPSLLAFEEPEKPVFKCTPSVSVSVIKDENNKTFVKSQTDFFNVNPNSTVAKYINGCFQDPNMTFLRKRVKRPTCMDLTQRLGDLKPNTQPELTRKHGTMLSCELWGLKNRIEFRQQLKNLSNFSRIMEQSVREREKNASIYNTSLEIEAAAAMCLDEDFVGSSEVSTKPTLNAIGSKSKMRVRGKSLVELRHAKGTPVHTPTRPNNDGSASTTSLNAQKKAMGRTKIRSVGLRPQQSEVLLIDQTNVSLKSLMIKKKVGRDVKAKLNV